MTIRPSATLTTVQTVLLRNTTTTRRLVILIAHLLASMTPIAIRITVHTAPQKVTTATWVTVCLIATQVVEDPLIVLSTTVLAV